MITHIVRNSDILLHLIDDIIDISKIESDQFYIINEKISTTKIFDDLFSMYEQKDLSYVNKNVNLVIKNEPNKEYTLFSDYLRLKQVIIKLIENAFKYTEKGTVEAGYYLTNDTEVVFFIKDTGIGMTKEQLPKIFRRFIKLESEREKLYRGAGLSLYLCKGIVKLLGGKIWVESELNVGSTFSFSIPFNKYIQPKIEVES